MKKLLVLCILVVGMVFWTYSSYAFFVGFGSASGAEQVIKKGQEEGVISKIPGETTPNPAQQGVEIVWQKVYNGGGDDGGSGIAVDSSGNVYVTGESNNGSNYDYLTIKYNANGGVVWQKVYNGGGDDGGSGIAVDSSGNVYVTGYSYNGANHDCLTIKYNSSGNIVWQKAWDGGNDDAGNSIAVDSSGNVYVTGGSYVVGSDNDILTIKYNTSGNTVWQKVCDAGNYDGAGCGIAVDSSGNVYVTGESNNNNDYDACLTIKYNGTNGDTVWQRVYNPGGGCDKGQGVAVDLNGFVYVTGRTNVGATDDILIIKYNSGGDVVWQKTYNTLENWEYGYGIAVDSSGNVYVTGSSYVSGNPCWLTIKCDSSGNAVWQKIFNTEYYDHSRGIAVDSSGYVYVAGESSNGSNYDCLTIKYRQY